MPATLGTLAAAKKTGKALTTPEKVAMLAGAGTPAKAEPSFHMNHDSCNKKSAWLRACRFPCQMALLSRSLFSLGLSTCGNHPEGRHFILENNPNIGRF
jgi:hypothetical protein